MQFIDDPQVEKQLFPFTLTREIADIRVGITTLREKWQHVATPENEPVLSHLLPLGKFFTGDRATQPAALHNLPRIEFPWHIFQWNDAALRDDWAWITAGRKSEPVSATNQVVNAGQVFLEPGAKVEHSVLNASAGPIYIGKDAEVMEGSTIRGPFALCEGAVVKMGTRIYGATTVGPHSVVGGELKNVVMFGYSNKGHDGYLGDAVIGAWCNLGAGTSNSNLKNNASEVKVFNPLTQQRYPAGMKCGLLMGDYSRSAINTSFNTGSVVGVSCNVFGSGLTPSFIDSFSWGYNPVQRYELDRALRDIRSWKKFKNQTLTDGEIKKLNSIFANTKPITG